MSNQLNITPGVSLARIDSIDTCVGRDMAFSFAERERYSAQRAKSSLALEEKRQEAGVNVILHLALSGTQSRAPCDVTEMVIDAAVMMTNLLVL